MKVTQEKLPASQIGLDIEITPEMSKNAYEQVVRKMSRSVNIPGFRKGKVPRHVLVQRLGQERIKAAALDDLMNQYLPKAVEQEKIPAIGNFEPQGDIDQLIQQFEPGQTLTIKVVVDVEPEVQLGEYKGLTVQAEEVKFDPEQVEQVLKQEQEKRATLIPVEARPAFCTTWNNSYSSSQVKVGDSPVVPHTTTASLPVLTRWAANFSATA